jgi:hypothetical protein
MSVWIVLGNAWHFLLLRLFPGKNRPPTISEHAVVSGNLLRFHKIIHSLPIIVFAPVVFKYLIPQEHYLAAGLLIIAVVSDCIEVLTLNKKSAPIDSKPNAHFFSAWLMSLTYLAYVYVISGIAGLNIWFYGSLLAACVLLAVLSNRAIVKKRSLRMQMGYFVIVSLVAVVANMKLILS